MDIRPIRPENDYSEALAEIERLWQFPHNSRQNDKLDVLATLVEAYEADRWSRRSFSPVEILQYAVADMGHSQIELVALLGSRPMASKLLRGKRRISLAVAQKISAAWRIPMHLLVAPYAVAA